MLHNRWRYTISMSLGCVVLASCSGDWPITSRDQAAGTMISATAIPWRQVAASMQPNFSLTADGAALLVAPVTQEGSFATLQALGVSASAGALLGPFHAPSTGASAVTTPASVPNEQAPTGNPTGAVLPTPSTPNTGFAIDPMLRYRAANALFQDVQMLNADLTSSFVNEHYVPYLVKLKLSVTPYRSNLPYDLFARISFFKPLCTNERTALERPDPESGCSKKLPIVVPLIVTDDIERAASSTAAESATQLAAALSILAPYAQASGSVNSLRQTLESISGQNFDSLLTVGRASPNTVIARIGAAYQTITKEGSFPW